MKQERELKNHPSPNSSFALPALTSLCSSYLGTQIAAKAEELDRLSRKQDNLIVAFESEVRKSDERFADLTRELTAAREANEMLNDQKFNSVGYLLGRRHFVMVFACVCGGGVEVGVLAGRDACRSVGCFPTLAFMAGFHELSLRVS